jgi:hypothetical protein
MWVMVVVVGTLAFFVGFIVFAFVSEMRVGLRKAKYGKAHDAGGLIGHGGK